VATLQIDVADEKVAEVQALCDDYNALTDQNLKLREFAIAAMGIGLGEIDRAVEAAKKREQDAAHRQAVREIQEAFK
jgi:hypothetical protein